MTLQNTTSRSSQEYVLAIGNHLGNNYIYWADYSNDCFHLIQGYV